MDFLTSRTLRLEISCGGKNRTSPQGFIETQNNRGRILRKKRNSARLSVHETHAFKEHQRISFEQESEKSCQTRNRPNKRKWQKPQTTAHKKKQNTKSRADILQNCAELFSLCQKKSINFWVEMSFVEICFVVSNTLLLPATMLRFAHSCFLSV